MGFAVRIPREFCSALMFHTMRAGFFCGSSSRVFSNFEYLSIQLFLVRMQSRKNGSLPERSCQRLNFSPWLWRRSNIYNASALRNDTPHTLVYQLLEPVVRMKTNPELPPVNPIWRPDGRLNNLLACFAQYWLTGTLDGGQRLLLDNALRFRVNSVPR